MAEIWNKPDIPAAYHLPPATTSTVGGIKAGYGLNVTEDGTLKTTANDVVYGSFIPTVTNSSGVTYHIANHSYGRYILNNRMVHIEIYVRIESISEPQTTGSVRIYIPPELRLSQDADIRFSPAISIISHDKIVKDSYTLLGGHLHSLSGQIELIQYGGDYPVYVNELRVGSRIEFSVNYILN